MKKILSMFLVLCLVLTMLPVSVMAEETHMTIDNFTDLQGAIDSTAGDLNLKLSDSYTTSNGTLTIDNNNNHNITIDLNGKTLDGGSNNAIKHNGTGTLTIKDTGINGKVTSAADKVINSISYGTIDLGGGILVVESGIIENTLNRISANAILKEHYKNGAVILKGGTIIAAQGTAIYYGYLPSMSTSPNGIIIPSGTPIIKGGYLAMNKAPDLSSYTNVKVTASINYDGSDPVYNPDNYYNYKYLKFEQGSDTTVSNLNLTSKLTAPATGGTPATTITDDQYTGTITWSDNPTMFIGDMVYTATVTLTAKDGYTFSGVYENAFSYDGATSAVNSVDSDNTMTITIVFPQTMARTLQQITITTPPTKATYYCGENFEKAGMIVKASYDDGTTDENFINYTVDKTEALTLSDNLITLTAEGTSIKTTQVITLYCA